MPLPPEFWDDPAQPEPAPQAWEAWEEAGGRIAVRLLLPYPVTTGQPVVQDGRTIGVISSWTATVPGDKVEAVALISDPEAVKALQIGLIRQPVSMGVTRVEVYPENLSAQNNTGQRRPPER